MADSKNLLEYPLPEGLVNFIKEDQKEFGDFVVTTIECTIKDSTNHYEDLLQALSPLLGDKTQLFLQKIFMYRKRECRLGDSCEQQNCLFLHSAKRFKEDESIKNNVALPVEKKINLFENENKEVVFNKVDENKYDQSEMRAYAEKYGTVELMKRLNKGKYLIIFADPESSQKLIECPNPVMGDLGIKKFFNVMIRPDPIPSAPMGVATTGRRFDIVELLQEQKEFIEQIEKTGDISNVHLLRLVTLRIRNYILQKENKTLNGTQSISKSETKTFVKKEEPETESIYSTFFSA